MCSFSPAEQSLFWAGYLKLSSTALIAHPMLKLNKYLKIILHLVLTLSHNEVFFDQSQKNLIDGMLPEKCYRWFVQLQRQILGH